MARVTLISLLLLFYQQLQYGDAGVHQKKLLDKLLSEINPYERPAENDSQALTVEFGLTLQQVMDVDEKNQIINTNMWITMLWSDYKMRWDPKDYGGITEVTMPSKLLWKPDILMYNSAAESFDGSYQVGVVISHTGTMKQMPPGIFTSTCHINIRWFPFDEQECLLKYGSWTYDGTKIDLRLLDGKPEGSTDGFQRNGEWDLIGFPGARNVITYDCCPNNPFVDLTFRIKLRRRKLYYMVNIIAPCMLFAFLGLFTYALPPDAGEKISFSVTVLLSLTVFMMIVADTLPATSEAIPLIAVYFSCIMALTAGSIISTIVGLCFHHRNTNTHFMPRWVKVGVCEWLAWILWMKRPGQKVNPETIWRHKRERSDMKLLNVNTSQSLLENVRGLTEDDDRFYSSYTVSTSSPNLHHIDMNSNHAHTMKNHSTTANGNAMMAGPPIPNLARFEMRGILRELRFITERMKEQDASEEVANDWKWAAMVLDRLFIWLFALLNVIAATAVLLTAPNVFN